MEMTLLGFPYPSHTAGGGGSERRLGGKNKAAGRGLGARSAQQSPVTGHHRLQWGENQQKQKRSGGYDPSRKLVLGFNSESSHCERKISECTAPGSAWESRS